jgi:hypothetical protein
MVCEGTQVLVLKWVALGVDFFHELGWLVVGLRSQLGGLFSPVKAFSNGDFFKIEVQVVFRDR